MNRLSFNILCTVILSLCICKHHSYAQRLAIPQGNFTIQDYDITDGLRQMQVNRVYVSRRGEVWVGTRSGICTFHNGEFDTFDDLIIKPNYVSDIKELSDGTIVILAMSSLYYYDGTKFKERKLLPESRYTFRANISIENDNKLLLKNYYDSDGIIVEPDTITKFQDYFPYLDNDKIRSVVPYINSQEYIILTTDGIINICSNDSNSCQQVYKSSKSILSIYEGNNHSISNDENLRNSIIFLEHLKYKEWQYVLMNLDSLSFDTIYHNKKVNTKNIGDEKSILLKTGNSIALLKNKNIDLLIDDYKTPYHNVLSLCIDNDQYYVGTDKGLVVINETKIKNYNGERYENIWDISETSDNKILLASYSKGLKFLGSDSLINVSLDNTLSESDYLYLKNAKRTYYFGSCIDENGSMYLSHQDGLFKYEDKSLKNFYPKKDIQKESPTLINYYDSKRNYIIRATCPGVDFIDMDANLIRKIDTSLFAHNCILTINKTDDDIYWFGATGGIAQYNYAKDTVINYTYSKDQVPHYTVVSSLVDEENNLWIGGKGGLSYYNSEIDSFLLVEELRNYEVASIIQAGPNKYFLATVRGLLMVDLGSYLIDGNLKSRLFTSKDGMQGLELGQNGFFKDTKGHIWVTTATNIIRFDPADLEFHSYKMKPVTKKINNIRVGYNNSIIPIEKGENNVTINYGILNNDNTKDIRYRYRLNNRMWSNWTSNHTAQFASLGSGQYTFELECKNIINNDITSSIHKSFFQVDIPFYKEPFINKVLGLLIVSLLILIFLLYRNRQLKLKIVDLLEEEKNKLIFEKKELESINRKLKRKMTEVKAVTPKSEINQKEFIEIKVVDKIHKILLCNIIYIMSEDGGVRIKTLDKSLWTQVSMKAFLKSLSDEGFIRIHRRNVVNIRHIKWVNHVSLMMNDNTELKIGRTYKDSILKSFG